MSINSFFRKVKIAFMDKGLRERILFVFFALILFRVLASVPVPGVDPSQLQALLTDNQFFGLLNLFSGGGLSQLSIIMLGVGPYITASIIMQLLTIIVPKFKAMYHEDGEIGRQKFYRISRFLTVPIAFIQGFGLWTLLSRQGILNGLSTFEIFVGLFVIVAGSLLITWIGELISEFGIGNGVSLIIFAGIIAVIPQQVTQLVFTFDMSQLTTYIGFGVVALLVIAGVVLVSEAERPVPITYAKQVRGGQSYGGVSTYLPLRINMSGVMPLIFALSILLFPQMIAQFLATSDSSGIANAANFVLDLLNRGWLYSSLYFLLVFGFTYFYTAITFDTESTATNLQKSGAFVPGVRPGEHTSDYIGKVLTRITFIGAIFLGAIAVIPIILQSVTGIAAFAIGGTGLLIVVAVVLDILKKVDAQVAMREY